MLIQNPGFLIHKCSFFSTPLQRFKINPFFERLKGRRRGRQRTRWMDCITEWMDMSFWESSRRWWRTGRPDVLQSMGSQLDMTEWLNWYLYLLFFRFFLHIGYYRRLIRVPCAIDKAVVHVIRLTSFLWLWFVCLLSDAFRNIYHLTWVSLTLDVGYLFRAAPAKHSHCCLPWRRGKHTHLCNLLTATPPDLECAVAPLGPPDGQVMEERSDRMWPTGEGNGKPLQYSCLENPMNSMKRQNDRILKQELPRLVGAQYATGDQ